MRQRGFTLIEVLIVAAIVITVAVFVAAAQIARPFGMRSAVSQFDAAVAYARSLAAGSGNGATIVFTARTDGQGAALPGFIAQVYSGRPNSLGPVAKVSNGTFSSSGDITESTLGKPPFSLFFNGAGHASGITGAVTTSTDVNAEPPCPSGRGMSFRFTDPRATDTRTLACTEPVAGPPAAPFTL